MKAGPLHSADSAKADGKPWAFQFFFKKHAKCFGKRWTENRM